MMDWQIEERDLNWMREEELSECWAEFDDIPNFAERKAKTLALWKKRYGTAYWA